MPSDYINPFQTQLSPAQQVIYQRWLNTPMDKEGHLPPHDESAFSDYDMPGFWLGLQNGHPRAEVAEQTDGLHFTDYWKTPYHNTFSNESRYDIDHTAPHWKESPNTWDLINQDGSLKHMEIKAPPLDKRIKNMPLY